MIIYEVDGYQKDAHSINSLVIDRYKKVDVSYISNVDDDDACLYTLKKNGMCMHNNILYINIEHNYNNDNIFSDLFLQVRDELHRIIRDDKINTIIENNI